MIPMASLQVAKARAAELHKSAERSRGARQVALAARQRDVLARRKLRALLPDRPIVTAKPLRPRAGLLQPGPAEIPAPAPAPAPVAARPEAGVAAAADAGSSVAVLTPCRTC
jgi:hypothetical protein